jgi:hypothetical protein
MSTLPLKRLSVLCALGLVLAGSGLLAGCKSDSQFSKKEIEQFKQGPPKEMPPEARKMLEEATKAGHGPTGGPGQPAAGK